MDQGQAEESAACAFLSQRVKGEDVGERYGQGGKSVTDPERRVSHERRRKGRHVEDGKEHEKSAVPQQPVFQASFHAHSLPPFIPAADPEGATRKKAGSPSSPR
jgi:hypothetical protein